MSKAPEQLVSLVKYTNPIQISTTNHDNGMKNPDSTEEYLRQILPPREWKDDGQLWIQYASATPATAQDVFTLHADLDKRLKQRGARESGLCPIREELYQQCFDELIRQITLNGKQRGMLLTRVRDELRNRVACYKTLYESSIAFGMHSALQDEQSKIDMKMQIKQLEADCKSIDTQAENVKLQRMEMREREANRKDDARAAHQEHVRLAKENIAKLRAQVNKVISEPKDIE